MIRRKFKKVACGHLADHRKNDAHDMIRSEGNVTSSLLRLVGIQIINE